jgi:hypothetical protein
MGRLFVLRAMGCGNTELWLDGKSGVSGVGSHGVDTLEPRFV